MTDPRAVGKAAIVMVVLVFVWGYAWILSKMALAYCAPLDFATIRIALATGASLGSTADRRSTDRSVP